MNSATDSLSIASSDASLAAAGDDVAFGRLVARHDLEMTRVAFVVLGDHALAQDAAQAAWFAAWRRLRSIRDTSRIRPWLLAIAANEARQIARRGNKAKVVEIDPTLIAADGADPATGIARLDLARALGTLSPDDRALLALRYLAGLDAAELGAATGRSASGVRARLSRLTARLRTEIER